MAAGSCGMPVTNPRPAHCNGTDPSLHLPFRQIAVPHKASVTRPIDKIRVLGNEGRNLGLNRLSQSFGGVVAAPENHHDRARVSDVEQGTFVELPPEQYKEATARGLRVARDEVAPDLLVLPIAAPKGVGQ